MYLIYCRAFQIIMRIASLFLPWRKPELLRGQGSLDKLPKLIRGCGIRKVLIITDKGIVSAGIMEGLLKELEDKGIRYRIYDGTIPNPTIENIEEALRLYRNDRCEGIIGFGGGSPMDCAKGVAARVARPGTSIPGMKGLFKVLRKTPVIFAVPTTAGTGSEATVAAVVKDDATQEKYPINDLVLIPGYAVLDPLITKDLPPHITATTGMDALTHAVEAYIGRSNTRETYAYSRQAVKLIFDNIYEAFQNGKNLKARENMQKAAYYAGVAFTRAYVGNVHAVAHTLGGFYSIPHGLANAVILPYVLEYYGHRVDKPLSELADLAGISKPGDSDGRKAARFIREIRALNRKLEIPERLRGIKEEDIALMAERAFQEANPLYPVPVIFSRTQFAHIYYLIKE